MLAAAVCLRPPTRSPLSTLFCTPPAASRGNRLESAGPLLFSLCLSAPVVIFHVYYLQLQTYVLRLDVVLQAIALAFVGVEVLLQCRAFSGARRAACFCSVCVCVSLGYPSR